MVFSGAVRFVSLGDSSGVGVGAGNDGGYPARLAARLRRHLTVHHDNLAESGATSADVARAQVPQATRLSPSLVTVGVGGNDLWRLVPTERFADHLERVVNAFAARAVDVVLLNVVDLSLAPIAAMAQSFVGVGAADIAARVDALNDVVARVVVRGNQKAQTAGSAARFFLADVCAQSRQELNGDHSYFAGDGFHPSARGYDRLTDIVLPVVESALRERGHRG